MKTVFIVLTSLAAFLSLSPVRAEVHVAYGEAVRVDDSKVILDRRIISTLAKKPSLEAFHKNLWEVVYFVNIFDRQAISVGIDLLALANPNQVKADDHHGVHPLARALTNSDYVFWEILAAKPAPVRKKVIEYFDVNKNDYVGHDYEDWKKDALKGEKAR
jgi:hypothetical protein